MENIRLSDKFSFFLKSIKANGAILIICSAFILIGVTLMYIAYRYDGNLVLYGIGGFTIALPLFGIILTFPSSYMYHYEQAMAKKYGYYTKATIVDKEVEDISYTERVDNRIDTIELYNYIVSYSFKYKNRVYNNSFLVDNKTIFDKLELQSLISIKFLKTDPKKATVLIDRLLKERS